MAVNDLSFCGVIPNLITPFHPGGDVDWDAVKRETELLDQAGVDGICVGAYLSETSGSTAEELFRLCQSVRNSTRKPVLAVILPDSEPEAVLFLDSVTSAGADAVLIAQPHYLFQPDSASLLSMFERLRAHARTPILLANLLRSAQVDLSTFQSLQQNGLIDGVLQAGGDAHLLVDLLRIPARKPVFSGVEDLHLIALILGANGLISDLATVFPEECVALHRYVRSGNHETARTIHERLLRLWRMLDHPAEQLSRVRLALAMRGRNVGEPRSPYSNLSPGSAGEVARVLRAEGILV